MVTVMSPLAKNETLVLSDSGSTICFVVKSFMDKIGIAPLGSWNGLLETVNENKEETLLRILLHSSSADLKSWF